FEDAFNKKEFSYDINQMQKDTEQHTTVLSEKLISYVGEPSVPWYKNCISFFSKLKDFFFVLLLNIVGIGFYVGGASLLWSSMIYWISGHSINWLTTFYVCSAIIGGLFLMFCKPSAGEDNLFLFLLSGFSPDLSFSEDVPPIRSYTFQYVDSNSSHQHLDSPALVDPDEQYEEHDRLMSSTG
ncbi:hypothetical protein N9Y17_02755, partial [Gammaproteobacteria bacterium]|nr:hypothetical protein [Gammaproteobacteria bacterium]